LLASNRVEWKQARAIRRRRIVVVSQSNRNCNHGFKSRRWLTLCGAGGYWSVEHETSASSSSPVTLCLSKHRLSLLVITPGDDDDDDLFSVHAEYSIASIVCWKLDFVDRQRCHIAYLSVTVAPDDEPANCNYVLRRRGGSRINQGGRTIASRERGPITVVWGGALSGVQAQSPDAGSGADFNLRGGKVDRRVSRVGGVRARVSPSRRERGLGRGLEPLPRIFLLFDLKMDHFGAVF